MRKLRIWILSIISSGLLILSACAQSAATNFEDSSAAISSEAESQKEETSENTSDITFSMDDIAPYSDEPYVIVNHNVPYFLESDLTTESFEIYSDLDSLGRCGVAYANICTDIMPSEERGEIGQIKPSGWHTVKYNDIIDGNYLYNRCHLIAYQLTGENANEQNLITGTRYLNIQGMLPFETQVADYVKETNNHVLYRVTPIFEGENLIASGVLMEAKSVEDNAGTLQFCVYVYNIQPGIAIDYLTGESSLIEDPPTQAEADSKAPIQEEIKGSTYILNTNTKKFHYPSCSSVDQMKEKNKQVYTGNREDIISQGYEPCKRCNP